MGAPGLPVHGLQHGFAVRTMGWVFGALLAVAFSGMAAAADGAKLFTSGAVPACALCHTLAAAKATGQIGPSLDELQPDAARVEKAIRNGIGQMPANRSLSDADVATLSRYVARATGAAR